MTDEPKEERQPKECPFLNQICRLEECELYMNEVEKCAFYVIPLLMAEDGQEKKSKEKT